MIRLLVLSFLVLPSVVAAYEVFEVTQPSPFEITPLPDVVTEQWLTGVLEGFPETFEFLLTEPTLVRTQVMVPAGIAETQRVSLITVREVTRGVEEVMRRSAAAETWSTFTDPKSRLVFDESAVFEAELEPGIYRVEVSNADNEGQYVLKLGIETSGGYFDTISDIWNLRSALGLNPVGIIFNKLILLPVLAVLISFGLYYVFIYRRRESIAKD